MYVLIVFKSYIRMITLNNSLLGIKRIKAPFISARIIIKTPNTGEKQGKTTTKGGKAYLAREQAGVRKFGCYRRRCYEKTFIKMIR